MSVSVSRARRNSHLEAQDLEKQEPKEPAGDISNKSEHMLDFTTMAGSAQDLNC